MPVVARTTGVFQSLTPHAFGRVYIQSEFYHPILCAIKFVVVIDMLVVFSCECG